MLRLPSYSSSKKTTLVTDTHTHTNRLQYPHYAPTHVEVNEDISQFWSAILALENTMEQHEKYNQGNVTDYPNLCALINHCCQVEHYTFRI